MQLVCRALLATGLSLSSSLAVARQVEPIAPAAVRSLEQDSANQAVIKLHPATGAVRFLQLTPGSIPLAGASPRQKADAFLARYGRSFGIEHAAAELTKLSEINDRLGHQHHTYEQAHRGVPVFASRLKLHFDARGELTAANGTIVPDIALDTRPVWDSNEAGAVALAAVSAELSAPRVATVGVGSSRLVIYREGLLQGIPGPNHLCWEVEVGNGDDVREQVFVDAHTGKIVERISRIFHAIERSVHEPAFNDEVIWSEGDSLPYSTGNSVNDGQVNGLIELASDVRSLYSNLSSGTYLSWDGSDGPMHTVWKAANLNCPNASWNGTSTNYCDGVASDDVAAHEWTHAYTEATHGLIYLWQPGALNEAYSDMFGEIVDFINGAGTDSPGGVRTVGDCTTFAGGLPPSLQVLSPFSLAGNYVVAGASFNPASASVTAAVGRAVDGSGNPNDGCSAFIGFPAGRIALIDRGNCMFVQKVTNAQNAGASAVIIIDNDNDVTEMTGSSSGINIASVMVGEDDGEAIETGLGSGSVQAKVELAGGTANSLRWLMGEDAFEFSEPIRDLWNPRCKGDPAQVSDSFYWCSAGDGGGVHTNSGVPNHAFALLVDGGTFNGHTVAAIGQTKAAHLYWRAMTVYQVPASDFADHAAALAQSCADLVGAPLTNLITGAPSPQTFSAADCNAVNQAIAAVELEADPPCAFEPLLAQGAPAPACGAVAFSDDFETNPAGHWTLSNFGVYSEWAPRNWSWTADVPEGGSGSAFFALDSPDLGNCIEGDDDQSGAMQLDSPPITLGGNPLLVFDHYMASEPGFDGGNLKVSVNGGPWQLLQPDPDLYFVFNSYTGLLNDNQSTNPLGGQYAFHGADGGEVTGSWGQSQVDLSSFAGAGDQIRLRFEFGMDGCNGLIGWYVDDVLVCTDEAGAGSVPDGSGSTTPLTASLSAGQLTLAWADSCAGGDGDYAVYQGNLGAFTSHVPVTCTTAGATSHTFSPASGNAYYLVVPRSATREGSYGSSSAGIERPASDFACLPQAIAPACP